MEPRRVEEIVAVNEYGNAAAVAEFPRRTGGRLELHYVDPKFWICGREMQNVEKRRKGRFVSCLRSCVDPVIKDCC